MRQFNSTSSGSRGEGTLHTLELAESPLTRHASDDAWRSLPASGARWHRACGAGSFQIHELDLAAGVFGCGEADVFLQRGGYRGHLFAVGGAGDGDGVSDSSFLTVAPKFAAHFVRADLRHFPESQGGAALAWLRGEG